MEAMASSFRGVFCKKRSKGIFETQSLELLRKKLTALLKSQVSFDRGLNMLPSVKVCKNATKQILRKFVSLIFFKIVVLKATPDSKPIPNFNHLQQRSFHRRSSSQMFFKIGVSKRFVNLTGKHQCWSYF